MIIYVLGLKSYELLKKENDIKITTNVMLFSGSCGQQSLKKKIAKKINTGLVLIIRTGKNNSYKEKISKYKKLEKFHLKTKCKQIHWQNIWIKRYTCMAALSASAYINKVSEHKDVHVRLEYRHVRNFIGIHCISSAGVVA